MNNKHPLAQIGVATFIALMVTLPVHMLRHGGSTKALWLFLIIALVATIFGMAVMLFFYSRKLRVVPSKLKPNS